jgi:hypothetical protein
LEYFYRYTAVLLVVSYVALTIYLALRPTHAFRV